MVKIAATYENGNIFQHFGHTAEFKIYEVLGNQIISAEVVNTMGSGHGALAGFLREHGVDVLICGGIGGGAINALNQMGIELYPGASGSADDCVLALLAGNLQFNPDTMCDHHHHGGGCGEHSCGEHKHGCSGH